MVFTQRQAWLKGKSGYAWRILTLSWCIACDLAASPAWPPGTLNERGKLLCTGLHDAVRSLAACPVIEVERRIYMRLLMMSPEGFAMHSAR
jgi:hypothetical protein